jgi:hypothetical protein
MTARANKPTRRALVRFTRSDCPLRASDAHPILSTERWREIRQICSVERRECARILSVPRFEGPYQHVVIGNHDGVALVRLDLQSLGVV